MGVGMLLAGRVTLRSKVPLWPGVVHPAPSVATW
jgi:hypothetical protein